MNDIKPQILQYLSLEDLEKMDQNDPKVLTKIIEKLKEPKKITIHYQITRDGELYSDVEYEYIDPEQALVFEPMKYYQEKFTEEERNIILTGYQKKEIDDTFGYIKRAFLTKSGKVSKKMPKRKQIMGDCQFYEGLRKIDKNYYEVLLGS